MIRQVFKCCLLLEPMHFWNPQDCTCASVLPCSFTMCRSAIDEGCVVCMARSGRVLKLTVGLIIKLETTGGYWQSQDQITTMWGRSSWEGSALKGHNYISAIFTRAQSQSGWRDGRLPGRGPKVADQMLIYLVKELLAEQII